LAGAGFLAGMRRVETRRRPVLTAPQRRNMDLLFGT
jgi:hypothetical protein